MPSGPDPQRGTGSHGYLIWRGLILFGLVLTAVTLYLSTKLFTRADESIDANQATLCKVGAFLVGTPLIQQPGVSDEVFVEQLLKVRSFLRGLREINCAGLGPGAEAVTPHGIHKQLHAIHGSIQAHGGTPGGGGSQGTGTTTPGGLGGAPGAPPPTEPRPPRPPPEPPPPPPTEPPHHRKPLLDSPDPLPDVYCPVRPCPLR